MRSVSIKYIDRQIFRSDNLASDLDPHVDTRRHVTLAGLQAIPQDNSIEVPIPLIDDTPSSSLDNPEKPLSSEPDTPRPRAHAPGKSSVSAHRPIPRPIALPTASDIAGDVESSLEDSENTPHGRNEDLERGRRMASPHSHLSVGGGMRGQPSAASDRSTFSPAINDEDARLLRGITIEPPTPVTTDPAGELITLPHKRRSPTPAEDLLNDDAPLPISPFAPPAESAPRNGKEALVSPQESEPNGTPSKE